MGFYDDLDKELGITPAVDLDALDKELGLPPSNNGVSSVQSEPYIPEPEPTSTSATRPYRGFAPEIVEAAKQTNASLSAGTNRVLAGVSRKVGLPAGVAEYFDREANYLRNQAEGPMVEGAPVRTFTAQALGSGGQTLGAAAVAGLFGGPAAAALVGKVTIADMVAGTSGIAFDRYKDEGDSDGVAAAKAAFVGGATGAIEKLTLGLVTKTPLLKPFFEKILKKAASAAPNYILSVGARGAAAAGEGFVQEAVQQDLPEWFSSQPKDVQARLREAGLAGLGGAVFSTAASAPGAAVDIASGAAETRARNTPAESPPVSPTETPPQEAAAQESEPLIDLQQSVEAGTPPADFNIDAESLDQLPTPQKSVEQIQADRDSFAATEKAATGEFPSYTSPDGENFAAWRQRAIDLGLVPRAQGILADAVAAKRPLNRIESAAVAQRMTELNAKINGLLAGVPEGQAMSGTDATIFNALQNEYTTLDAGFKQTGEPAGRDFVARKMVTTRAFEYAAVHARATQAKGSALTTAEETAIRKQVAERKTAADELVKEQQAHAEEVINEAVIKRARKGEGKPRLSRAEIVTRLQDLINRGCYGG